MQGLGGHVHRDMAPIIRCICFIVIDRDLVNIYRSAPPPPGMSERTAVRLRAWHRHERLTVAMELATTLHHSAQRVEAPREGVELEKKVGLRAQKPPRLKCV